MTGLTLRPLNPLAPAGGTRYDDGAVRVRSQQSAGWWVPGVRTAHFTVRETEGRVEIVHRLPPERLDNNLGGMIVDELIHAELIAPEMFERVFVGVVRTCADDPAAAWRLFYDNTLAQIRRCWDSPNPPPTHIAQIAPVYRRALGLVPPGRVLDMGSCFGFFPLLLADAGQHRVLATDLVPGSMNLLRTIAQARGSAVGTMSCDAAAVPLPDRCVDTVTVLHLLEHLDRAHGRAVLAEAVRLAAQRVIVAVPFEDEPDPSYGHIRTFDTGELSVLGIETGLPFTVAEYHGGWLILDTR
ncbi:class I SAM-dependent methyltransferase [Nocardia farcinica]|uniref:Methyltransferase domain n=2 Tax=Nocardia TaxID=1817 RepID=A0A0H5NMN8_NOCFR|nr:MULTISPECIES: mycofactocin oligosaccharide methyltransferase MftM [Nocardia]AXK85215.1 class I SAM-dependent methyltransferase [Nocardia farcinica]MBA4858729.1 class I SAM-dependent methyltransferase [Nocardia farcinica]MBC9818021.1 class I SAM-dependent methyltransferase [Nocardia farcinica]MBF6184702.1 class I SAM-dependent methyltransferase [Nocardia farcinica]MBF6255584.1 class I SAM-dependent methyltransferase [Nocardia farcinica]